MADQSTLVEAVIRVLHDSSKGFPDIGEHLKDNVAKSFFMEEGHTRATFARELEAELPADKRDIGGTGIGAIHRNWGDLKAKLGGGDHTLLETAEQGEDAAKKAYQEALEASDLSATTRQTLLRQQQHIVASHNKVKAMRDTVTV